MNQNDCQHKAQSTVLVTSVPSSIRLKLDPQIENPRRLLVKSYIQDLLKIGKVQWMGKEPEVYQWNA
jgi:hypothetical protein